MGKSLSACCNCDRTNAGEEVRTIEDPQNSLMGNKFGKEGESPILMMNDYKNSSDGTVYTG